MPRRESSHERPQTSDPTKQDDVEAAIALAAELLGEASAFAGVEPRSARRTRRRVAAIVGDDDAQLFTMGLTDQVLRIDEPRRAARRFADLTRTVPTTGFGAIDRILLRAGGITARYLPTPVMWLVSRRLRGETRGLIIPAADPAFTDHVRGRRDGGFQSNINVLGEAILGDGEATRRLLAVLDRLARPDVDYVSVKISAISARVNPLAFDDTVDEVAHRLRRLYRAAQAHHPMRFVNLDMEEYRDLELTAAVFRRVLDEPEFNDLVAGIVLQAYLPDSHAVARELCEWAVSRVESGGAPVKVRLVKGANLAMEHVEAELRGWDAAPFGSKGDVDASYKVLLGLLLDPRYDGALRVGLASHNLFDISWALLARRSMLAASRPDRLEFEMLEGMAPDEAAAVKQHTGSMLLYTPVVAEDDFAAAIAYLVRRLDENTTPENYLTAAFAIEPDNDVFRREAAKFSAAVARAHTLDLRGRRRQDRSQPIEPNSVDTEFVNEPDTDFTVPANRRWIAEHLAAWSQPPEPTAAAVTDVDAAVERAVLAQTSWAAMAPKERATLINRVGDVMAASRGHVIATMAFETAKTVLQGDPEVSEAIDFARYYARSISRIHALDIDDSSVPLGTVVVTPPWNFPYAIAAGGVLAALSAGNTVILKPAPEAMATAALLAEHCWQAGIPTDVLQFVPAPDDDAGQRLIMHPRVDAVILTGAYATAQMFLSWKPSLRLHAETSGKNAMIITAAADLDLAIKDLVQSAFGHAGQKCSAASLAIVEASVYDSPKFRRQLADAVETLRVGRAEHLATDIGRVISSPSPQLHRALTRLDAGETWLVEPRVDLDDPALWSPGVRLGVRPGSWYARTECFGPVLGLIRAADLEEAIHIQNDSDFGLTAGIHSLDVDEIDRWTSLAQAGNLYVNRGITGAIVQRQPFGGWKRSAVGPTAKAGGPNYVASLRHWPTPTRPGNTVSDFRRWAHEHGRTELDPTGLAAERNVQRYRALSGGVAFRIGRHAPHNSETLARAAAEALGVRLVVSDSSETDDQFSQRLPTIGVDRVRIAGDVSDSLRASVHAAGLALDERPIHTLPEIELPRWLLEQAVSRTLHRHGHLIDAQN